MESEVKKVQTKLTNLHGKLLFVSLLLAFMLVSLSSCALMTNAQDTSLTDIILVENETTLQDAIDNAPAGIPVVIALDGSIALTNSLKIPAYKDITLVSSGSAVEFFSLIGPADQPTITVQSYGALKLDGIIVTHEAGSMGEGIRVDSGGKLVMSNGEISGNTNVSCGGVYVSDGSFTMTGGVIANNTGRYGCGGVYMFEGSFTITGGVIANNTGSSGGVIVIWGSFTMSGGVIADNIGDFGGGGGVVFDWSVVSICDDVVYNNHNKAPFVMTGGVIANNTAMYGGGIYVIEGNVYIRGGVISDNTASRNGGGIYVERLDELFVSEGAVFSNNHAPVAYDRAPIDDWMYNTHIDPNVVWTSPFPQGYNNYDIGYTNGIPYVSYPVAVIDSYATTTGAGDYVAGATVRINAGNAPENYQFKTWETSSEGVYFTSPISAVTTFYMPDHNVEVTAIFGTIASCVCEYVNEVIKEATCIEEGTTVYTCLKCNHSYPETININPNNHMSGIYAIIIKEPTCKSNGLMQSYCSGCNAQLETLYLPPDPMRHKFIGIILEEPTCITWGLLAHTCSECNYTWYFDHIAPDPNNHVCEVYEQVIIPPTCETKGLMGIYCSDCHAPLMTTVIDKLQNVPKDYEFLAERVAEILKDGLRQNNLRLDGTVLTLVIDDRDFVLSTNANNRNIDGEIALGDGYFLKFDIKGNGSNIKMFDIIIK